MSQISDIIAFSDGMQNPIEKGITIDLNERVIFKSTVPIVRAVLGSAVAAEHRSSTLHSSTQDVPALSPLH